MNIQSFFFIPIIDLYLVAEPALPSHFPGQAVKTWEKLAGLHAGVDDQINSIPFLKLLEVLAQGEFSPFAVVDSEFMPGFSLLCPGSGYHARLVKWVIYKSFGLIRVKNL